MRFRTNVEYETRPVHYTGNTIHFGVRTLQDIPNGFLYFEISYKNRIIYPNIKCDMEWVTWPYEYRLVKILDTFLDDGNKTNSAKNWRKGRKLAKSFILQI